MLIYFNVVLHMDQVLLLYFVLCTCVLVLGLGWLLSALQVFYRDISHGLSIVLNLWFWATPIVWAPENMPQDYRALLAYNPLYYIVEGYRGLLISDRPVWPEMWQTAYFWSIAAVLFFLGAYVFGRLKPEFADVM
jgi:lipopolysaccharide transport system permease protein/teichoic acid transport system permease protein